MDFDELGRFVHSNRNAVLTGAEIEWIDTVLSRDDHPSAFDFQRAVLLAKHSKNRERSIEEVMGCSELLSTLFFQAQEWVPLTEGTLCGLHHRLLGYHPPSAFHAGGYKVTSNPVVSINHRTQERQVVLDPTPPGPQTDSIDRQIEWHRSLYHAVLHQTSGGKYRPRPADYVWEPLNYFFIQMLREALKDVAILRNRYRAQQKLSENARRTLICFKSMPEKRLKVSELILESGMARRTTQNSLMALVRAGSLQRLGSGPSSRYQLVF